MTKQEIKEAILLKEQERDALGCTTGEQYEQLSLDINRLHFKLSQIKYNGR